MTVKYVTKASKTAVTKTSKINGIHWLVDSSISFSTEPSPIIFLFLEYGINATNIPDKTVQAAAW